jgi:biotin carboxyl carrier protein
MLKISIQNGETFEVKREKGKMLVNGEPLELDTAMLAPGSYHILHEGRSYRIEILQLDWENKQFSLRINGKEVSLKAQDEIDILLEKMGMSAINQQKINKLAAPMPGLILDVVPQVGDHVKAGDKLVILEAMKMENVIKSPGEGVVKEIKVKKGESVEKNAVLIIFE